MCARVAPVVAHDVELEEHREDELELGEPLAVPLDHRADLRGAAEQPREQQGVLEKGGSQGV